MPMITCNVTPFFLPIGCKIHNHSGQLALLADSTASNKTPKLSHTSHNNWQPADETNQMELKPNNSPLFGDDCKLSWDSTFDKATKPRNSEPTNKVMSNFCEHCKWAESNLVEFTKSKNCHNVDELFTKTKASLEMHKAAMEWHLQSTGQLNY